jgi:hypothetical protein
MTETYAYKIAMKNLVLKNIENNSEERQIEQILEIIQRKLIDIINTEKWSHREHLVIELPDNNLVSQTGRKKLEERLQKAPFGFCDAKAWSPGAIFKIELTL